MYLIWLDICSSLNGSCTYGQFDIQPVAMCKASTILSRLYSLCFSPSILNQVGAAGLVAKWCDDGYKHVCGKVINFKLLTAVFMMYRVDASEKFILVSRVSCLLCDCCLLLKIVSFLSCWVWFWWNLLNEWYESKGLQKYRADFEYLHKLC